MTAPVIDTDEWLEVWRSTGKLESDIRKLKEDNLALKDEVYRLVQKVNALERRN